MNASTLLLIIIVALGAFYMLAPCEFNDTMQDIPLLKNAEAECNENNNSLPGVNETLSLLNQNPDAQPLGKPTFDCATDAHCILAFDQNAKCETQSGVCYQDG